jgi:proteasome lid subunit RPN8/RPN11
MRARVLEIPVLVIGMLAFQVMIRHAEREQPREAVGMLGGLPSGQVSLALPLVNLAGKKTFLADPYAQYLAEKRIFSEGLSLLGIYHSHPGGGACLSAVDCAFAQLRDVIQVVIVPRHGDRPLDAQAYRVRGDKIVPVALRISSNK